MDKTAADYRPIEPDYLNVLRVRGLIFAAVLTAIAFFVDYVVLRDSRIPLGIVTGAAAAVGVLLAFLMPRRRYRAWGYRLDEDELHIRAGLMIRHRTAVPFARVQHIDVSQGPIERRYRLGRLTLHTAGTRTAAVWVPGLRYEEAERIRDLIRGKIRQDLL